MVRPNSDQYLGNRLLAKRDAKRQWTEKEVQEFIRCSKDPIFFVNNFVKIVHVDRGLVNFKLYDYQEELINHVSDNRFSIVKASRQSGKTTTIVCGYLLWYILFNEYKTVGILANKETTSMEILGRLQRAYENLPEHLQQGVLEFNKSSFSLENGSKVLASATSSGSVRGFSFSMVYIDEAAHVPANIWHEFYTSTYPTISSGKDTKIILVSTPQGLNHYYKLWSDSENNRNSYKRFEINWRRVPGRDDTWRLQEIANLGSIEKFNQEHETEFLGSSDTLINGITLRTLKYDQPIYNSGDGLSVYEKAAADRKYFMVVDPAEGLGRDNSAFVVFDITEIPYKTVAVFANNKVSELVLPDRISQVGKAYFNCPVLIEINKGLTAAHILFEELEYENILFVGQKIGVGQVLGSMSNAQPGIKTSKSVKRVGCNNLKSLVENGKIVINDYSIISELSTFVKKLNSYAADDNCFDDLTMCCVIFAWCVEQDYFQQLNEVNLRKAAYNKEMEEAEENNAGFIINPNNIISSDFGTDEDFGWMVQRDDFDELD